MKKILSILLVITSFTVVAQTTNPLNNLEKDDLSWKSYSSEIKGLKLVHKNDSQHIKLAEVRFSSKDSIEKITYLFLNDVLTVYTITYKKDKKPDVSSLCKIFGECTPLGNSAVYWRSKSGKIYAYSWNTSNTELIFTCTGDNYRTTAQK